MKSCLVITGPTASGKTHLAVTLARQFSGEILSADSRQVYRGLDIGTGKDLDEYTRGGEPVPFHLIDVALPNEDFHLFKYIDMASKAVENIASRHKLPVIAGGTPLYIKALLDGYDQEGGAPNHQLRKELEPLPIGQLIEMLRKEAAPELFARTDITQKRRIIRSLELARFGVSISPTPIIGKRLIIAPFFHRKTIHARIEQRLDDRLNNGLLEEVQRLHNQGMSWERMDWLGLEYRFAAKHLTGQLTRQEMRDELLAHIRQFCKRQDGWFRKLEREGKDIYWIPNGDVKTASELTSLWLDDKPLPKPQIRLDDIRY